MKIIKRLTFLAIISVISGLMLIAGLYFYVKPELPSVEVLKDVHLQTPMLIYSEDGELINQYGEKKRIPLKLSEMPTPLLQAVLATEDSRFFEHPGIDPIGVLRAAFNFLTTGQKRQGASTITMQLAREFFLTRDKQWMRKIKEMFIAWHIEGLLTKDEILELYLNKISFGHRSFGVGAAAQVYYGKNIDELTLAQLATIAGLPKAPSTMNPISRPQRSIERRRVVLGRMLAENYITQEQYQEAYEAPVTAERHGVEITLNAPYIADMVNREMIERFGAEDAYTRGYRVYTTTPAKLQRAAEFAVVKNLHDYDERHGYRGPVAQLWEVNEEQKDPNSFIAESPAWDEEKILNHLKQASEFGPLIPAVVTQVHEKAISVLLKDGSYQFIDWPNLEWAREFISDTKQGPDPKTASDILKEGAQVYVRLHESGEWQLGQLPGVSGALVAINPRDGAIRSLIGGYSFQQSQFNRATQAMRQVGSNIKPFIYSSALQNGYTLASVINDAPINQWNRASGTAWRPENSPPIYEGPLRMRIALGKSKNVVSVRLLRGVGLGRVISYLGKFGFNPNDLPNDESLALGSASLTPLEVATGFATFANGGFKVEPYIISRIEDAFGNTVYEANPKIACLECENGTLDNGDESSTEVNLAERVISSQNAFLVTSMMQSAINGAPGWRGTGWRARNILNRRDLAGKTGTTNDAKDTWFSGFHPDLVATSWVGFDDMSRSLGETSGHRGLINRNPERFNWMGNAMMGKEDGARVAQPAWIRFMKVALEQTPPAQYLIPENIVSVKIDKKTGKLTDANDKTQRFEFFEVGTEPTESVVSTELSIEDGKKKLTEEDEIF